MTLKELIHDYHTVQSEIKDLEQKKKDLKVRIDLALSSEDTNRYEDSQYSAVLSQHQRVKYDLEGIEYLLLHKGIPTTRFLQSKVDLKKLEELIADGLVEPTELLDYSEVKTIKTLTVKES
jgi:cell division septum initiation protein DivIVA